MHVHIVEVGRADGQTPAFHYAILSDGSADAVETVRRTLAFGGAVQTIDPLPWMGDVSVLDLKPGKPKLLAPPEILTVENGTTI